ncbi:MAG: dimethylsulfonioproprionate lyase family protein [Candidatus Kariarchaeaceae archaeon]|jgi:quercetin dioxygenase-like cupin family protein
MNEDKMDLDWVFNRNSDTGAILRKLGEGISTRIFVGKDSMLSFVRLEPHTQGSTHSHPEEQWGILLEGSCVRIQEGKEIKMTKGDFWYSGPNVEHGIRTEEEAAVILDVFSPPRPAYREAGEGFGVDAS